MKTTKSTLKKVIKESLRELVEEGAFDDLIAEAVGVATTENRLLLSGAENKSPKDVRARRESVSYDNEYEEIDRKQIAAHTSNVISQALGIDSSNPLFSIFEDTAANAVNTHVAPPNASDIGMLQEAAGGINIAERWMSIMQATK
ncbi:MAG: hypothetical protein WDA29_08775 [Flavobacteriaceae bacterium]